MEALPAAVQDDESEVTEMPSFPRLRGIAEDSNGQSSNREWRRASCGDVVPLEDGIAECEARRRLR